MLVKQQGVAGPRRDLVGSWLLPSRLPTKRIATPGGAGIPHDEGGGPVAQLVRAADS